MIMSGEATPAQIGALPDGAPRPRRDRRRDRRRRRRSCGRRCCAVEAPPDAIDVVGTGGDAAGTYNISTTTAFVVAGAGVPVAKHGNRALSSKSGAADVLSALGVKIDLAPETIARCIREAGIGFMFAPAHHSAMKHVGPTRAELGIRTIFNLLGPLVQSGRASSGYCSASSRRDWVEPLADALRDLGTERAWVVHGDGGLDEISIAGADHGRRARRTAR